MRTLVAVPSRGRAHRLDKTVLRWLKHVEALPIVFFVEPAQAPDYMAALQHHPNIGLNILPDNNQGLEYALHQIFLYAKLGGFDLVFHVDDDVTGWTCRTSAKDEPASARRFEQAVVDAVPMFEKYPALGGVGYPYSFQMFDVRMWTGMNQRLQTSYLVRTEFMETPYDRTFEWCDFYRTLRIRSANCFTLRYGLMGIDCEPVAGNAGGAQDFPRAERAEATRAYFQKLCPDLRWRSVPGKPWTHEPDFGRTPSLRGKVL